ncbi:hypothetical protein [Botrimarina sp.]|uniref:hypothetical protein n=1 Tax=Botrimarina sp. TaxID=2795802 RepID=UPI0032EC5A21
MPIDWDADADFGSVVDTLETVRLVRRSSAAPSIDVAAWRFDSEAIALDDPPHGSITTAWTKTTDWQLPTPGDGIAPAVGDSIVDSEGRAGVVLSARWLRARTRWLCRTRRVELSGAQAELFDAETPAFAQHPFGRAFVGWRLLRPALPGVWLPGYEGFSLAERRRLLLDCGATLWPGDRLRSAQSGAFLIEEISAPRSPTGPQTLLVAPAEGK